MNKNAIFTMDDLVKVRVPKSETYFAIPNDLTSLKGLTVLEYLKRHVWLSYARERRCREIFDELLHENLRLSVIVPDFLQQFNIGEFLPKNETLSISFLHKGLLQLYRVLLSSRITDELMQLLEYDKLQFTGMNFREWCVISAFAERHLFGGPFECTVLEFDDLQYYKEHGNSFDISPALRKVFDIIDNTHRYSGVISIY